MSVTRMRKPRMHGRPPHFPGSTVMRSNKFMALGPDMLDHLYIRPGRTGRGIGSRFVGLAKSLRPARLDLYTFQVNGGARRFYERHGFVAIWFGDGSANEERQPDVRYHWAPGA